METSKKTTVKRAKPQPPKVEPGEEQVLQFKLTLDGLRPKIWRRVQVSSQATMFQFAHIIMELFQMENAHLYAFTFPETEEKKNFSMSKTLRSRWLRCSTASPAKSLGLSMTMAMVGASLSSSKRSSR